MDALSIVCIVVGCHALLESGLMFFAPVATLRFADRVFFATTARLRACGVFVAAVATALLLAPLGEGSLAGLFYALGWIAAAEALVILVVPDVFRRFMRAIWDYFETSVGDVIMRVLCLLGIALGVAMIYVGIYVV